MTNRTRQHIAADILEVALEGRKQTIIMYKANLSFAMVKRYLALLESKGLIAKDGMEWRTTVAGREYVKHWQAIKGI